MHEEESDSDHHTTPEQDPHQVDETEEHAQDNSFEIAGQYLEFVEEENEKIQQDLSHKIKELS